MQRYEKYKDSGVDWIGEIPEDWENLPAKRFHKVVKIINKKRIYNNVLSLTLRGVVNNNLDKPEGLVPKDYATYQFFEKDDLVFKLIDLENVSTSRVGLVHEDGIMSSAYIRLKTGFSTYPKYAFYYYYSLYKNEVYNKIGSGVRSTLGPNDLLNLIFINPPLQTQITIATFLDKKTAKIDQTIANKQKEIELLKERRQILIQKAVTKGLDDTVRLKDSGVDWIGEIPEHWEVRKLKYLVRCMNTKRVPLETTVRGSMSEKNYPYYGATGIIDYVENYIFDEETILIAEDGANLVLRNLQLIYKPIGRYWVNNHSHILKPHKITDKDYLSFLMEMCDYTIYISGAAQPKLTKDNLLNIYFLNPPKKEQTQIVSHLEVIEEKIAKAILLKQQEIEKLKEYKTVLIDNVVTGKVRVS